jgi:hypothetical protein
LHLTPSSKVLGLAPNVLAPSAPTIYAPPPNTILVLGLAPPWCYTNTKMAQN